LPHDDGAEQAGRQEAHRMRQEALAAAQRAVDIGWPDFAPQGRSVALGAILGDFIQRQEAIVAAENCVKAKGEVKKAKTLMRLFGDVVLASKDDMEDIARKLVNPSLPSAHGRPLARDSRNNLFKTLKKALVRADERGVELPRNWHTVRLNHPKKERTFAPLAMWTLPDLARLYETANDVFKCVSRRPARPGNSQRPGARPRCRPR
jgi:hypothetical protein